MIFGLKTTIFLHDRNKTKLVHATLSVRYYHSYLPSLISTLLGIWWPRAAAPQPDCSHSVIHEIAASYMLNIPLKHYVLCLSKFNARKKCVWDILLSVCQLKWFLKLFCEYLKYCRMFGWSQDDIYIRKSLVKNVCFQKPRSMFPLIQQDVTSFSYCSWCLVKIILYSKGSLIMI